MVARSYFYYDTVNTVKYHQKLQLQYFTVQYACNMRRVRKLAYACETGNFSVSFNETRGEGGPDYDMMI